MARKSIEQCAYCGSTEVLCTSDHVVPKALWPKGNRPKKPIMAWACEVCHPKFDKQVEYFRSNIVMTAKSDDQDVWKLMNSQILPSVRRPKASRRMIDTIKSGQHIWVPNEHGVLVGRVAQKIDTAAHLLTILKIVKGLHYVRFGDVLEIEQCRMLDTGICNQDQRDVVTWALKNYTFSSVKDLGDGSTTFSYRYCDLRGKNDLLEAMWAFRFVGGRVFFALVLTPECAEQEPAGNSLSMPI